jgi:uncharacterized protein involved in exopolysaccharide biosynthesis
MELRRYLAIVAPYRWLLVSVPLIAAVVAFAATYAVKPRFVSVAVVQLIPEEIEPQTINLRSQDGPSTVALGLRDPTELLAQGIIENLGSREVAQIIVDDRGLTPGPPPTGWDATKAAVRSALQDVWTWLRFGYVARPSDEAALVEAVGGAIRANVVPGSYYMQLSATWDDPETAADLANASVRALLTHSRRVAARAAAERRHFIETQMAEVKQRVDAARRSLLAYSSANAVVAAESIRAALATYEAGLAAQRENERALAEARQRQAVVLEQLAGADPTVQTVQTAEGSLTPDQAAIRATVPNPAYQALQTRIADLRQEVGGLEAGLDGAPADQRADRDRALAEAKQRLTVAEQQLRAISPTIQTVQTVDSATSRSSTTTRTTAPSLLHQTLQDQAYALQQEVAALEVRQSQLAQEVRGHDQVLRQLTARDGQLAALGQELSLASEAYSRRTAQWYDALFEEARPITQIRLVDPAIAPLYPAYPVKITWALIGAATGLVLVIVLIFLRHAADVSVRSSADAEAALDLPLLTVLPTPRTGALPGDQPGRRAGGDR